MNLASVMANMTLRQMDTAERLWRAEVGEAGPSLQEALSASSYRATAAMLAAKMRVNGHPDCTIEEALDMELDMGDAGEAPGGNGGVPPRLSPVSGS